MVCVVVIEFVDVISEMWQWGRDVVVIFIVRSWKGRRGDYIPRKSPFVVDG